MSANNSFKPNPLRYTNNMAGKACHVVGSATRVGLTQVLGRMTNFRKALASFAAMLISLPLVGITHSWWVGVIFPIGLVLGILYLIDASEDRIARKPARSEIQINPQGITRRLEPGKLEQVSWANLEKIEIITTADGPWGEDVFWVLSEATAGCVVANGDAKIDALVEKLQSFPGFNNQAVIKAMGSTSNNRFLIWQRQHAP